MTDEQRRLIHAAMVRLAQGNRDAFTVVFDELWPHVLRFVTRAMSGHPDAEDVAQQTLLRIFARISDFDIRRDGVAWAFGIAWYEVSTLRQQMRRRRESPVEKALDRATSERTPEEIAIDRHLHETLREALVELTAVDRAALLDEALQVSSDISPAARRKRRQRALERLRTVWRKRHA